MTIKKEEKWMDDSLKLLQNIFDKLDSMESMQKEAQEMTKRMEARQIDMLRKTEAAMEQQSQVHEYNKKENEELNKVLGEIFPGKSKAELGAEMSKMGMKYMEYMKKIMGDLDFDKKSLSFSPLVKPKIEYTEDEEKALNELWKTSNQALVERNKKDGEKKE